MTISPAYSSSPAYMESTLSGLQRAADSVRAARAARQGGAPRATSTPPGSRRRSEDEILAALRAQDTPRPARPTGPELSDMTPAQRALYLRAWPNESEKR